MAKIFYNGNKIIVDGHADTAEECRAITAMCDSMANDENFKTIVYESGHAVFERVSGGESEKFSDLESQIQNLQLQLAAMQGAYEQVMADITNLNDSVTEVSLVAEAANAKSSNAEQLALNAFYMAQEATQIAQKVQSDLEDAIKRAEDAAVKAEAAQRKAEDAVDRIASSEEIAELSRKVDNILTSTHKLPYTAAQIEAKLATL